jgi:hypothetical protein
MNRVIWFAILGTLVAVGSEGEVVGQAHEQPNTAVQRWRLTVSESAGIRRFGYPVSAVILLDPPLTNADHFQLLLEGKPQTAQFRPHGDTSKGVRAISVDFVSSIGPRESLVYHLEHNPDKPAAIPTKSSDNKVETDDQVYRISSGGMIYEFPRDLAGLIRTARDAKRSFVREGSRGLWILYKDHIHYRAGAFGPDGVPTRSRIVKDGPLHTTIRYESVEFLRGGRSVDSVVEIDIPRAKSWICVTWRVADPNKYVAGLGADLNLALGDGPTLVDFGAGSLVYAKLGEGERAVLRQDNSVAPTQPRWQVLLGKKDALRPHVVGPLDESPLRGAPHQAEGWAHVMDKQRCTAVGVEGFSDSWKRDGKEEIIVDADGRLRIWKHGSSTLRFYLHFVSTPVHLGAITSPQSMLAPLQVEARKQ